MSHETSIVPVSEAPKLLRPIAQPAEVIAYHQEAASIIRDALEKGRDYGKVPGTDKETLFKPGAERLGLAFGLRPVFEILEKEIDHDRENRYTNKYGGGTSLGLYRYVVRCTMMSHDGREVGQGVGACSSLESKYVRSPRDAENTILKMAKKRALIDAVLTTLGLSDRFTQDTEDMAANQAARKDGGASGKPFEPKAWVTKVVGSKYVPDFVRDCEGRGLDPWQVAAAAHEAGVAQNGNALGAFVASYSPPASGTGGSDVIDAEAVDIPLDEFAEDEVTGGTDRGR